MHFRSFNKYLQCDKDDDNDDDVDDVNVDFNHVNFIIWIKF